MARRATEAFTTWAGGYKRRFAPNDAVPDEIADKVLELTYDDGVDEPPKKRAAKKKAAAKSDD